MFRNYLKTAFRNLWKYRFYSGINLLGLASGILCFLFIAAFIQDELSYDRFHEHADRIYRINFKGRLSGNELNINQVGPPVGATLQAEFPEVENYVRFRPIGDFIVSFEDKSFQEDRIIYADSMLLEIFSFELAKGERNKILRRPNTAILTESMAQKYFGDANPIGKRLKVEGEPDLIVDGVLSDIPRNSHIQQEMFISLSSLEESRAQIWTDMNFNTYLLLSENADVSQLEAGFPDFIRRHVGAELERFLQMTYEDFLESGNAAAYTLTALEDIYLRSEFPEELGPSSDIQYLYVFGAVALIVLLLAGINFINLSTARASTRSREVGVRKVVGAQQFQLIGQFLSESTLLAVFSLLFAIVGIKLLLPFFNTLTDKSVTFSDLWQEPAMLLSAIGVTVAIGLLAGAYPSFYLSGFKPLAVLSGSKGNQSSRSRLRNGLVVFQFAITTLLLIGTFTVYQQMQYIQQKNLGFNKEQLLLIDGAYGLGEQIDVYKAKMQQDPRVSHLATTSYLPTPSNRNRSGYFKGNSSGGLNVILQAWFVDDDFLPTMGFELLEGRNFRAGDGEESREVIVNEETARQMDVTDDPIGKQLTRSFGTDENGQPVFSTYTIVGVVRDFHFESLHDKIEPMVMHQGNSSRFVAMRVQAQEMQGLISEARSLWEQMAPHLPFNYTFLDERFAQMYEAEARMSRIAGIFSALSILIACIGLIGLATFTALQRQREISIRKVLGASLSQLFLLLTQDFAKLILVAFILGLPLGWFLMRKWLQGFAYATPISVTTFLITAIVLLVISLLAISYQSLKTAQSNPAEVLKGE